MKERHYPWSTLSTLSFFLQHGYKRWEVDIKAEIYLGDVVFSLQVISLSDSTSQLLQRSQAFFLVLRPVQPEGVLVFHDVGQHRAAQEHHVFTPGRVLDADPKLLHRWGTRRGEGHWTFVISPWLCVSLSLCLLVRAQLQEENFFRNRITIIFITTF